MNPRTALTIVDEQTIITVKPLAGSDDTYAVAMGAFPARVRLDDADGLLWVDVAIGDVTDTSVVYERSLSITYPEPQISMRLQTPSPIVISYGLRYDQVSKDEVIGVIAAGAMYGAALAAALEDVLTEDSLESLTRGGYIVGVGFPGDPRGLLRSSVTLPWPSDE